MADAQWTVLEPLVEAARQGAAAPPAADDHRDPVAARERRQVALDPDRFGAVVDIGAV